MALNMRRAAMEEIAAVPEKDVIYYISGREHHAPEDNSVLVSFFDSWLEAHYAFSGGGWDASMPGGFILGGEDWHAWDPQTEPTKLLAPDTVRQVDAHLQTLTPDLMAARVADHCAGKSGLPCSLRPEYAEIIVPAFDEIISFVRVAAEHCQVIVKEIG